MSLSTNLFEIRLTLRYATLHQGSDYVAQMLEAARLQGDDIYWKTLEAALNAQPMWAEHGRPQPQRVWDFMDGTGLDIARAKREMNDPRIVALLKQDTEDRVTLNVKQTPTFFINGKPLIEFSLDGLRSQLRSEMRLAYKP
jgi:protein-disulfide isomerase